MAIYSHVCFSSDGSKFCQSGFDGILRLWDTNTNVLEHEYKPAEHLTAGITSVKFAPTPDVVHNDRKKKKLKSRVDTTVLALGTVAGTVVIYSTAEQEVKATLEHGDSVAITDVAWGKEENTLYSLGRDDLLVQWDVPSRTKIRSIPVRAGASRIATLDGDQMIVGTRGLDLIGLKKGEKKPKKRKSPPDFTGHTSAVTQVVPFSSSKQSSSNYFLTSAQDDRFVYMWDSSVIADGVTGIDPAASFRAKDRVEHVSSESGVLGITTRKGALVLHSYDGTECLSLGKVRVLSEDASTPLPVISSHFRKGQENTAPSSVIVAYGIGSILCFERIELSEVTKEFILTRADPSVLSASITDDTKIVIPIVTKNSKHLAPGHQVEPKRRVRKRSDEDNMNAEVLGTRLAAIALEQPHVTSRTAPPKADNMTHLLLQGLHSKDERLLSNVFSRTDEAVMQQTVRRLPVCAVVTLLTHLTDQAHKKGEKKPVHVMWVRAILQQHMAHLSSLPQRQDMLRPYYSASGEKAKALCVLSRLHGRLNLLLSHAHDSTLNAARGGDEQQEALLVYQDESSDDDVDYLALTEMGVVSDNSDSWTDAEDEEDIEGDGDEDDEDDEDDDDDENLKAIENSLQNRGDDDDQSSMDEDEGGLIVHEDEMDDEDD